VSGRSEQHGANGGGVVVDAEVVAAMQSQLDDLATAVEAQQRTIDAQQATIEGLGQRLARLEGDGTD
jgi:uncharacterized coiled-coil protein SlyX